VYAVPPPLVAVIDFANLAFDYSKLRESLITRQENTAAKERKSQASTFESVPARYDMKIILSVLFITMITCFVMDGTTCLGCKAYLELAPSTQVYYSSIQVWPSQLSKKILSSLRLVKDIRHCRFLYWGSLYCRQAYFCQD
jgi:hypothetical protein